MAHTAGMVLDADPPMRQTRGDPGREPGRTFIVRMTAKDSIAHLGLDGDALHRPRHEDGRSFHRHDQEVRREIAPMVEAGQVENVFRRRDDRKLDPAPGHG